MLKLDTHAHWFPPEWVELLEREGGKHGAEISRNEQGRLLMVAPGIRLRPTFTPPYVDIATRLKIMDEARVDMHALSLTSPMVYWASPDFLALAASTVVGSTDVIVNAARMVSRMYFMGSWFCCFC